ncbi:MAG: hypothetical protein JW755_09600, partial [Candidatus Aminicenantes bacterium]|nr:hypothetical protein [Candidatus Aminicenantes bacterium]
MEASKPGSSNTKKWLVGCGVGCGVIIIIAVILVVTGVFYVKNLVKGFEESTAVMKTLTERYGRISEYSPDPKGNIEPDRLESFLGIRKNLIPSLEMISDSIYILSDGEWGGKEIPEEEQSSTINKIKTGLNLIPQISEYYRSRNQALLEEEMGPGEYFYIYMITYYSWMGKSLMDGPDFQIGEDNERPRFRDWDDEESREIRRDQILRRMHRMILPMMKNQYIKMMEAPPEEIDETWRKALEAEIEALEEDRYRLPWEDGVPDVIANSLEPFRSRLEESYSSVTNMLELAIEQ